jgi:hypothetical protein
MEIDRSSATIPESYVIIVCMYIATVPNRPSPPAMLLRESFREGGEVRTHTLANLTAWAPERIEALRRALQGACDGLSGDLTLTCGPIFAGLFVLTPRADRLGLTRVLGKERLAKLARLLGLVRIAAQGSRLSAVRWATHHAVAETLGQGRFDEDDLDAALDALAPRQEPIEDPRYRVSRRQMGPSPTVVLYAVTASYFEGECNELAAVGDNRAKQAGKPQIVSGLVTTGTGEPIAVPGFDGTTADPRTGPTEVAKLRTRFGLTEVVFVGDRGLVKSTGQTVRAAAGDQSIMALTTPQVRKLLREGVLRPEWFTPHHHEVQHGPVRLVLRRSEAVRRKAERRRYDKLAKLHAWMTARNAFVRTATRAKPDAGLRTLQAWVTRDRLAGWVQLSWQEGTSSPPWMRLPTPRRAGAPDATS